MVLPAGHNHHLIRASYQQSSAVATAIDLAKKLLDYTEKVKRAPKERHEIRLECDNILAVLLQLKAACDPAHVSKPWYNDLQQLGRVDGPLQTLTIKLSNLVDTIHPTRTSGVKLWVESLKWPFTLDEVKQIRSEIDSILARIQIDLARAQLYVLIRTSDIFVLMERQIVVGECFRQYPWHGQLLGEPAKPCRRKVSRSRSISACSRHLER